MSSTILTSLSGAFQASLSVLLVIFYGVLASQFNLLDNTSAKRVSHLSVKLFLPFLLITKVGKELNLANAAKYLPILIWAILYNVVGIFIGLAGVRWLKLPAWVTPAVTFNNTTSLPLLLIQSLESTGCLDSLRVDGESTGEAISRAQSYFLVCSVVSNCLTFALGPRLLDGEEAREESKEGDGDNDGTEAGKPDERAMENGDANGTANQVQDAAQQQQTHQPETHPDSNETTSLLPDRVNHLESQTFLAAHNTTFRFLERANMDSKHLSPRTKSFLSVLVAFLNAPLVGAVIGCVLGLTPALHRAFFADTADGGIFTAWLTQSLQNTGQLFVSLQVIIVGVKLSSSLRKLKRGDDGDDTGRTPWTATLFVFIVRYVFWPAVSIPVITLLAKRGVLGGNDAILWFTMMLMPTGPPAMSLIPMADVSGKDEGVKMSVAKLLTGMYGVSPVLAFVIVVALKASQSAAGS